MPFSDEQFEKFIKHLDSHDLLIRIDENTKNFHKRFDDHIAENNQNFGVQKNAVDVAHKRIDDIRIEFSKNKGFLAGVISFATAFLALLQIWISFYKK